MKVRVCPNCGKSNLENVYNCVDCGATLSVNTLMDTESEQFLNLKPITSHAESNEISNNQTSQGNEESKIIITCEKCGQKLRVPLRRKNLHVACPTCHHEFNYEFVEASLVSDSLGKKPTPPQPHLSYNCPLCSQNDKVEKVSAIVLQGTHEVSGTTQEWVSKKGGGSYSTTVPFSGTYTQELARKLTPPSKPDYSPSFWWNIMPFTGLYWLAFWFAPISPRMKNVSILGLLFSIFYVCLFFSSSANNSNNDVMGLLNCLIAPIIIISIFVTYYIGLSEETTSRKAKANAELPKWEQAMKKWDKLYYCARNDCVFDPDPNSGWSIPADRMIELLFLRE